MSYDFGANNRLMDGVFGSQYGVPITLVGWFKLASGDWGSTSQRYAMKFGESNTSNNNALRIATTFGANDRISAISRSTLDSSAHLDFLNNYDSVWVPCAAVFESDSSRIMYIDGTTESALDTDTRSVGSALDSIRLGANAAEFNNLRGLLAEVAIFDKALNSAEVAALRTGVETGPPPNTVASANCIGYWPLANNSATHADESGNGGPTLTNDGGVWNSDHPTIQSSGTKSVSVTLADVNGNTRNSLNSVSWFWYDAIGASMTPTDTGIGSTSAAGVITCEIPNSTLNAGQTGYLVCRHVNGWQNIYPLTVAVS